MANTSCVDLETFYQKVGEVKASKKTKASKITLFIDGNFYNDTVTWLETRNEDSKDRTNPTSQDAAIIKRKDGNWRVANIIQERKRNCSKMSTTTSSLPSPYEYCAQRRHNMNKYIKRNYESVSQEVIQLFVSLCSIYEEQKSITSRQKQPLLAPIQARGFLTHLQMALMDLRNLPCTCSCNRKHNWILHMIDLFTKYSWLYPLKNKQAEDVLKCLSQFLLAIWIPSENTH